MEQPRRHHAVFFEATHHVLRHDQFKWRLVTMLVIFDPLILVIIWVSRMVCQLIIFTKLRKRWVSNFPILALQLSLGIFLNATTSGWVWGLRSKGISETGLDTRQAGGLVGWSVQNPCEWAFLARVVWFVVSIEKKRCCRFIADPTYPRYPSFSTLHRHKRIIRG